MRIFISPEDFTFIRSLRSPELIFELRWWGAAVRTAAIFETKPDQKREREGKGRAYTVGGKKSDANYSHLQSISAAEY